jgi:hypothetical protein
MWNAEALAKIRELKISILKKKIMLEFLVSSYSKWDKLYRWSLMGVALLSPFAMLAETFIIENESTKTINIIIGCLVAGLIKLKDYIVFDKIRDSSKVQTVKYSHLYERIERELLKPVEKRQSADEFIYWITREFSSLDLNDPELTFSDKKQFEELCRKNGIPIDEDMQQLVSLLSDKKEVVVQINESNAEEKVQVEVQAEAQVEELDSPRKSVQEKIKSPEEKARFKSEVVSVSSADLQYSIERLNNL